MSYLQTYQRVKAHKEGYQPSYDSSTVLADSNDFWIAEQPNSIQVKFCRLKLTTASAQTVINSCSTEVQTIDLSCNRIDALPTYLPAGLVGLNLSRNRIVNLSSPMALYSLVELNLSGNRIKRTLGLAMLVNIQYLDVSHNFIAHVEGLEAMRDLKKLRLNHNQLTIMTSLRTLSYNKSLTHLDLHDNPLSQEMDLRVPLSNLLPNLKYLDGEPLRLRLPASTIDRFGYSELSLLGSSDRIHSMQGTHSSHAAQRYSAPPRDSPIEEKKSSSSLRTSSPQHRMAGTASMNSTMQPGSDGNEEMVPQVQRRSPLPWRNPPNPMPRPWKGKNIFATSAAATTPAAAAGTNGTAHGSSSKPSTPFAPNAAIGAPSSSSRTATTSPARSLRGGRGRSSKSRSHSPPPPPPPSSSSSTFSSSAAAATALVASTVPPLPADLDSSTASYEEDEDMGWLCPALNSVSVQEHTSLWDVDTPFSEWDDPPRSRSQSPNRPPLRSPHTKASVLRTRFTAERIQAHNEAVTRARTPTKALQRTPSKTGKSRASAVSSASKTQQQQQQQSAMGKDSLQVVDAYDPGVHSVVAQEVARRTRSPYFLLNQLKSKINDRFRTSDEAHDRFAYLASLELDSTAPAVEVSEEPEAEDHDDTLEGLQRRREHIQRKLQYTLSSSALHLLNHSATALRTPVPASAEDAQWASSHPQGVEYDSGTDTLTTLSRPSRAPQAKSMVISEDGRESGLESLLLAAGGIGLHMEESKALGIRIEEMRSRQLHSLAAMQYTPSMSPQSPRVSSSSSPAPPPPVAATTLQALAAAPLSPPTLQDDHTVTSSVVNTEIQGLAAAMEELRARQHRSLAQLQAL